VLRLGGAQLPGHREELGVDALHLVRGQLDEARIDRRGGVVELLDEELARHPIGGVEPGRVDGPRLGGEARPDGALSGVGVGREVIDPVVEPVIAQERGEEGAGLEAGLPVPVGDVAQGLRRRHGLHGGARRGPRRDRARGGSDAAAATSHEVDDDGGGDEQEDDDEQGVQHDGPVPTDAVVKPRPDEWIGGGPDP
jgi:hypothetical protein